MKRHEDSVDAPTSNHDTQIYVLPPEILEQLGIQLTNINGSLADGSNADQSSKDKIKDIPDSGDETSILETAQLMKQSVFMSPTFVSDSATETSNQINNIPNIVTETEELRQADNELFVNNLGEGDNADKIGFSNNDLNLPYCDKKSESFENFETIDEYEVKCDGGMILTNVSNDTHNNSNIDLSSHFKKTSNFDDHADEAYLSDGSNINSEICSEITNNNLDTSIKLQKASNKIEILSEQIINHSDLPNAQSLHIQNAVQSSSCFLIPVDTIVTGKPTKDHPANECKEKIEETQKELFTSAEIIVEINDKMEKNSDTNNLETVIKQNVIIDDSLSVYPESISSISEGKTNKNSDILENEDGIKIIYSIDISEDEKLKSIIAITKEKISNTEKSSSKSKLCIQGVEKPGGTLEFNADTVLKTYQRTIIKKQVPELQQVDKTEIVDCNILQGDLNLDDIYISGYKHTNKFCICNDFGQLDNYDGNSAHEHIHFCEHYSVGCNLETLFSIYHDKSGLHEPDAMEDTDAAIVEDNIGNKQHNICWLNFDCENDETLDVAIYESMNTDQSNSSSDQPRRSNRKRKSTASENNAESVEAKSNKKTVNCGVCGLILTEADWNKHVDSEHDLIAWKDAQTIIQNNLPSTTENETLRKMATPELSNSTRRSSRSFNSRTDLTTFNTCKINHVEAPTKQIQESKSTETDSSKLKISASKVQIETHSISRRKSVETSSKVKDGFISKCTEKSKNDRKSVDNADSSKPVSSFNRVVDLESPKKCSRQSKTSEDTIKPTVIEVTAKSVNSIIDNSLIATKIEDLPKENSKTMTLTRKSNATEISNTLKSEARDTSKLKKQSPTENQDALKTTKKYIDDAGHPKPIPKGNESDEILSKLNAACTTKSSVPTKTAKNTVEINGVSVKSILNLTNDETSSKSTRKLKEIDIFSSPPKKTYINSNLKSSKKTIDDIVISKVANVETVAKSAKCSTDVTLKRTNHSLESEDLNKLKRKFTDADTELRCNEVDVSLTSNKKSVDTHKTPTTQKYIKDKSSKETTEMFTLIKNANVHTPTKTETKFGNLSTKRSSGIGMTKSETISLNSKKVENPQYRRKSNIMMSKADSPQKPVSVQVEIPAAKNATEDNNTTPKNNKEGTIAVSSSSINRHNTASLKANSIIPSDNANKPLLVEDIAILIKKEIFPTCAVCKQQVEESQWLEHIAKEHNYLAWREEEAPLNLQDEEEIRAHLYGIVKTHRGLKCFKCNVTRKYVKSYLTHIRSCNGDDEEQSQMDVSTASVDSTLDLDDMPLQSSRSVPSVRKASYQKSVTCGVCSETVLENKWIDHIRMEHKYLAWKSGEPPLDVNDEAAVKIFLQNISKYNGGLICSKCGAIRSYVKKWMDHESTCKGEKSNESESTDVMKESKVTPKLIEIEILADTVKCAKCNKEMPRHAWMDHIEKEHNYLSWIEGQPPLEETDSEAVSAYLHALVRKRGSLYCVKCGVTRKYPKAFLTHISACEMSGFKREEFYVEVSAKVKPGEYECAVCHETGNRKDWKKHAMGKHYNVAWMAGEIPINLKNPYAVEKYLKEYRTRHNLICKVCGTSRASCYGFYAHILTCGKAENELEHLMDMCDICNNKYLCIYRNQHKAMHKEQTIKKEKKERDAIKAEEESIAKAKIDEGEPMGKRRAAQKAKKVMEKYTSSVQDGCNVCLSCHIEFDNGTQLKDHVCQGSKLDDASDSDVSVKMEGHEESEDDMEGVDSSVSDEEEDPLKKKRQPETIPKITLPFKVKDFSYYLAKSFENFSEIHYTSESLFNNWRSSNYNILSADECAKYLPSLTESCKLRIYQDEWETYQRFEARKKREIIIFTGATIRCMQWVPPRAGYEQDHYLSVACFRGADCPRYGKEELPQHPGTVQIWNVGRFTSIPKFVMGLAHNYGTIWAMEWCPSGGRDPEPSESEGPSRLGLLAIACSNGSAYILSVPRLHSETQDEPIICQLRPVAELRLSVNSMHHTYRVGYQATSIAWSPQKGHDVVMVGYADGTTALYDLNTESPFLKAKEKDVDIIYPFEDALTENSTITGVALCASSEVRRAVGGQASASVTGARMAGWGRAPAVRSHLAASSVAFTPNWPAALLCSDDVLTMKSTNCMEWWGGGRRLGGACAAGACLRCGRVCLLAPPFVRVLRAHPAYPELKKQIVATMKMVLLARKRKLKIVNDDLGMIVEPLTYDDTVKKYGLEFKMLAKKDQNVASKLCDNAEQCPERFPLSDMPAAAFCPSAEHHNRLAVASHAGFLFIITT